MIDFQIQLIFAERLEGYSIMSPNTISHRVSDKSGHSLICFVKLKTEELILDILYAAKYCRFFCVSDEFTYV